MEAGDGRPREIAQLLLSAAQVVRRSTGRVGDLDFEILVEQVADFVGLSFAHEVFHVREEAHRAGLAEPHASDAVDHGQRENEQIDDFLHEHTAWNGCAEHARE